MQIEANAFLHPSNGVRNSPVRGVVLSSADLDHVLGLLLLRELQPFDRLLDRVRDANFAWRE